jgi:hypothetical protein
MWELRFSERIDSRWDPWLPFVRVVGDREYWILSVGRIIVGKAETPEKAVALVSGRLPADDGPDAAGPRSTERKTLPYFFWDDVKSLLGRGRMRSLLMDVAVEGRGSWQRFFEYLRSPDCTWEWAYYVDGFICPPPSMAEIFTGQSESDASELHISLGFGLVAVFRLSSTRHARFEVDGQQINSQASMDALCQFLLDLAYRFRGPVQLTLEDDETKPIMGVDRETERIVMLPSSGLRG